MRGVSFGRGVRRAFTVCGVDCAGTVRTAILDGDGARMIDAPGLLKPDPTEEVGVCTFRKGVALLFILAFGRKGGERDLVCTCT